MQGEGGLQQAAEQGDADAQFSLGELYQDEVGLKKKS